MDAVITEQQCGFKKGRSFIDNLFIVKKMIKNEETLIWKRVRVL